MTRTPTVLRTLLLTALAAAGLVAIDGALATAERSEASQAGQRFYQDGEELMQKGDYPSAANAFRSAIASTRDNNQYSLALGDALLKAGQLDEAGATLAELLNTDPLNGAPNLAMARLLARRNQPGEAELYYERAIYGQWPQGDAAGQQAAKTELDALKQAHAPKPDPPQPDPAKQDPPDSTTLGTLRQVVAKVLACGALSTDRTTTDLLADFNSLAKQPVTTNSRKADATYLSLAARLWKLEKANCPAAITPADQAIEKALSRRSR